ncbi:NRDE family protein [Psychromonas sp. KJ10-10]|uniref:NRDE family protein n=1 Tax=Psychromonas sp. KJ10-10 TaxID=3391823 RepID=UPI0039B59CC9
MCTLTYRLTESGYELFFNRDEQRSRAQALHPIVDPDLNAIYPIDPIGKGTWLAVHQSGLSLALLNFYQAQQKSPTRTFNSRGEIILSLLKNTGNVLELINSLSLKDYQPFQLCVFLPNTSSVNNKIYCFQWDGINLTKVDKNLPITSSGVQYDRVYEARKLAFQQLVEDEKSDTDTFLKYHQFQQENGMLSVKMSREDAQTVSFSHITVGQKQTNDIVFNYVDYLNDQQKTRLMTRKL